MKKVTTIISCLLILALVSFLGYYFWTYRDLPPPNQTVRLEVEQITLTNPTGEPAEPITIAASKLPEFVYDMSDKKFDEIIKAAGGQINNLVSANIAYASDGNQKIETGVSVDKEKRKLVAKPQDIPNFKPGMYKLSLKLRTLEGEIDIEQDFSWGVIAVNTSKSIYKPGDAALISMGVLDDGGNTQCMTGDQTAKVWLTVTDPNGAKKEYSTEDGMIKDSGECSAISVTNRADFEALYLTEKPGLYYMTVIAEVQGKKRQITDYFKVEQAPAFDVERTSFPTRIYPRSHYNVLFKVTAAADYSGPIEEIVPNSFVISSINNNGKAESYGNFTKIKWQVNLKKGQTQPFTYTINFPLVSPEFYLLGPITIGAFKEARQWQIASDAINSTSGIVAYEDNGGSNTWSRIWMGSVGGSYPQGWNPDPPTAATSMSTTVADGRWFVEKSSPKTGEKIMLVIDSVAAADRLQVFTWNGTSWGGGTASINIALVGTSVDVTRPADIAYEEESGDALLVYSDYSSNQLRYYTRVGGVWSASANAGTAFDVYKRWVRLEPQFNSDSILVGYLNNNERVGGMIWDGSAFGNQFSDAAGTITATSDEQAFDIAIETQSNTPMIFWGSSANGDIIMREFTGGSWAAESTITTVSTNPVDWMQAAADPRSSSNNISLAYQEGTSCLIRFGMWTGAAVTMNGTTATCPATGLTANNLVDTAFENASGRAMYTYVTSATPSQLSYLTWTSAGGFTAGTTLTGTTTTIDGMQLYSDLNTQSMILLYHDNGGTSSQCRLWDRQWDGTTDTWSSLADALHLNMCEAADNDTIPYGFGFDRNLEELVGYRWFENNNGVSVTTALTTQNSPYTLTSANQPFRLRLLLYYPDALAINGRQYKLQYVDPGTGTCEAPTGGTPATWTDVGTSGSDPISFNNNATPADGDNLTENVSLDPTYQSYTRIEQDYEESNNFTNSVSAMTADQVGEWDFSLIDNTLYDRNASAFCFRVTRSNNLVLRTNIYPQINTAAEADVRIQGGSLIQGGTLLQ